MRNLTAIILFVFMLAGSVFGGVYSGGAGSEADPYQIADFNDLMELANTPVDSDECFIMTADIDLDPNLPGREVYSKALIAADTDSSDYHYNGTAFTGVFDGNNFEIKNLNIQLEEYYRYAGLFGKIGENGIVKNLNLNTFYFSISEYRYYTVGGLAGELEKGSVNNCTVSGSFSGTEETIALNNAGLLVGDAVN